MPSLPEDAIVASKTRSEHQYRDVLAVPFVPTLFWPPKLRMFPSSFSFVAMIRS